MSDPVHLKDIPIGAAILWEDVLWVHLGPITYTKWNEPVIRAKVAGPTNKTWHPDLLVEQVDEMSYIVIEVPEEDR